MGLNYLILWILFNFLIAIAKIPDKAPNCPEVDANILDSSIEYLLTLFWDDLIGQIL